ncbi:MAG: hypothetical protein OXG85_11470 [Chloroflexi bacterium]|nr:hypothetical protein [Chloroflexota bacterium]
MAGSKVDAVVNQCRLARFAVVIFIFSVAHVAVLAHQPFCEFADLTAAAPWQVPDPAVSYAYFGNVYPEWDIDYFAFDAQAEQSILLSLSIPANDENEAAIYAPQMAVIGPELPSDLPPELPSELQVPAGLGAKMVSLGDVPNYFYEPFGRVHFWNYEDDFFRAPQRGRYTVALWHPDRQIGRYAFVIGQREEWGGDLECFLAYSMYWTPLIEGANPYRDTPMAELMHDPSRIINLDAAEAPTVDLQVFALADGGYNLQLQTNNFIFTPQNIDMAPVRGEGHAHLYVDGVKLARLYGEWHHLSTLPPDAEALAVTLYANNHQAFAVNGEIISDSVRLSDLNSG